MRHLLLSRAIAPVCLAVLAGAGIADETGEETYRNHCASCHGTAGEGGGPLAELMTVPVPPLNTLAQQNDGTFPMLLVVHTIDGRNEKRAHGSPMPIWGAAFKTDAQRAGNPAADLAARGRILSLASYLESIQK